MHHERCPRTRLAGLLRVLVVLAAAGITSCSSDGITGPGPLPPADLLILNSTGQTLAPFTVANGLATAGSPIDLGASFDGQSVDVLDDLAVATISSFGGSLIVLIDLQSGDVARVTFPEPEAGTANPSAPTFDARGFVWVGGRGSDAVYRLEPGASRTELVASEVGTFVERVLPVGDLLWAIDANLDDDGFTYRPLGPGRVVVLSPDGQIREEIVLPEGVVNAFDAVHVGDELIVLATGSFDESFAPEANGHLVIIGASDHLIRDVIPLAANGLTLERGANGDVYATVTRDFVTTEIVRYDPPAGALVHGPGSGVRVLDSSGSPASCWVATALDDDRMLCATYAFAETGRLLLSEEDGSFIAEIPSGFGSTDIVIR